jgi:hypothetical protein
MFETPDAAQTWSAETEAVAAEDADPLDIPIPTASYRDRNQRQQKGHIAQDGWTKPIPANPPVVIANPTLMT